MTHPGASGSEVTSYQLTPDETEVLYFAQLDGGNFGLHAVPVGGGPSRDLLGGLSTRVAPVGGRYVYSSFRNNVVRVRERTAATAAPRR